MNLLLPGEEAMDILLKTPEPCSSGCLLAKRGWSPSQQNRALCLSGNESLTHHSHKSEVTLCGIGKSGPNLNHDKGQEQ